MPAPPHSLHRSLLRLCSHCPGFPPRARFPPPLLPPSSPSGAARLRLPSPLCSCPPPLPRDPPKFPERPSLLRFPLLSPPLLPLPALAEQLSVRPLPLPPPPTPTAPALVAAPSALASQPESAHAISFPLPLLPPPASARLPRAPCATSSPATMVPPTARTASSRAPRSVTLAASTSRSSPAPGAVRSIISPGAAVPPLAPVHSSTVFRPLHIL